MIIQSIGFKCIIIRLRLRFFRAVTKSVVFSEMPKYTIFGLRKWDGRKKVSARVMVRKHRIIEPIASSYTLILFSTQVSFRKFTHNIEQNAYMTVEKGRHLDVRRDLTKYVEISHMRSRGHRIQNSVIGRPYPKFLGIMWR